MPQKLKVVTSKKQESSNEEIEEEIEEHGPIEYITLVIITILPIFIAAISYFIRRGLI